MKCKCNCLLPYTFWVILLDPFKLEQKYHIRFTVGILRYTKLKFNDKPLKLHNAYEILHNLHNTVEYTGLQMWCCELQEICQQVNVIWDS